jgi:uncharacterized protein (TIGR03435 family)
MIRGLTRLGLWTAMAGVALGQTDASGPAFEAASVKVSAPLPNGVMMFRMGGGPDSSDPGRITYTGVNLKSLVARAYGVKEFQVEGPQWLEGERYDVIATIPKGTDKEQVGLMMQRLLAERFKLTLHHESKPMAVYTMSVAKGGAKLKEVDPDAPLAAPPLPPGALPPPPPPPGAAGAGMPRGGGMRMMMSPAGRRLTGNTTIARLCEMLSNLTDRPVIDLTELKGTYAFDLSWTPDENEKAGGKFAPAMAMANTLGGGPAPGAGQPGPEGANDPGQTLVQALQSDYGLKLEAKKNPADILVIDHAEKVPTEN